MLHAKRNILLECLLATGVCLGSTLSFASEAAPDSIPVNTVPVDAAAAENGAVNNRALNSGVAENVAVQGIVAPDTMIQNTANQSTESQATESQATGTTIAVSPATADAGVIIQPVAPPISKDPVLADLQARLQPFLASDDAWVRYHAEKARAWLVYAANERAERSLSIAKKEALAEATRLTGQLEAKAEISPTTKVLSVSKVMRRDLWATAELLKQHPGFDCASGELAQAEVMLVWAAAEHCELGWRHSREPFAAAERLIDTASYSAFSCREDLPRTLPKVDYPSMESLNGTQSGCHGVVGQWPIVVPGQAFEQAYEQAYEQASVVPKALPVADEPVALPTPAVSLAPVIPNLIHFALDKSSLSAESVQVLDQVVAGLKQNPDYSVTLYGYTDNRASAAYNLTLSKRRAQSIASYLGKNGIAGNRIAIVAQGNKATIADSNALMGHALSRRVELVYASADGKEVQSIPQRGDIQLER